MKCTKLLLLIFLFLTSCAPPAKSIPTQTLVPTLIATQTPVPTPTITPLPTQIGGGSGRLIFEYSSSEFEKDFPDLKGDGLNRYVFTANIDGANKTPITSGLGKDNSLNAISPDGTKALVVSKSRYNSKVSNLFLVNLNSLDSQPIKIAQDSWSAKWIDDTKIIYVGQGNQGFGIYIINSDGTNPINIENRNKVSGILAVNKDRVYWNAALTSAEGNRSFSTYFVWWTNLDGSETGQLKFNGKQIATDNFLGRDLVFSPDGTKVAWMEKATATFHHNSLHIASVTDIEHPTSIDLINSLVDLKWRPDGQAVLVFDILSVAKADKNDNRYGFYEVSADSGTVIRNFHLSDEIMGGFGNSVGMMRCANISPDSKLLPCLTFEKETTPRGIHYSKLNFLNLETSAFNEVSGFNFLTLDPYAPPDIFWIP